MRRFLLSLVTIANLWACETRPTEEEILICLAMCEEHKGLSVIDDHLCVCQDGTLLHPFTLTRQ